MSFPPPQTCSYGMLSSSCTKVRTPTSSRRCAAFWCRVADKTSAGYYADSILKFRLIFPPNYPERPPTVQFVTDVFHPLVSQQDGTFNLAPRFRPWR